MVYEEVNEILSRAVCEWAGVPLAEPDVQRRTAELMAMFHRNSSPAHFWSRLARRRSERWIENLIEDIRAVASSRPMRARPSWLQDRHRNPKGDLLDRHTAAVGELINVLRPTVAVSVYITFAALALHRYPKCVQQLAVGEDGYADLFAEEAEAVLPLLPLVIARVRRHFRVEGISLPQGATSVLDPDGTTMTHEPGMSRRHFQPERFRNWDSSPFNFIPQGGEDDHRTTAVRASGLLLS